ncbi:MAG: DUF4129 domain-containing protein [Inquilinus sp.]|nr:DUF4129 domain-containing protein [Inquilinus sp.]
MVRFTVFLGLLRGLAGRLAAAALLGVALTHGAMAAATDDPDAVRRAAEDVLAGDRIQQEMPSGRPERPPPEPPSWLEWIPEGLADIVQLLMWIVIIVVGIVLIGYLTNEVAGYKRRERMRNGAEGGAAGNGADGADGAVRTSLTEADRLAQAGRFGEALHVLLLCCLGELRRRHLDAQLAPSLTSREILARLSLPERAAAAFAAIVAAVELSHFGGRPADAGQYDARRADFLLFADESGSTA